MCGWETARSNAGHCGHNPPCLPVYELAAGTAHDVNVEESPTVCRLYCTVCSCILSVQARQGTSENSRIYIQLQPYVCNGVMSTLMSKLYFSVTATPFRSVHMHAMICYRFSSCAVFECECLSSTLPRSTVRPYCCLCYTVLSALHNTVRTDEVNVRAELYEYTVLTVILPVLLLNRTVGTTLTSKVTPFHLDVLLRSSFVKPPLHEQVSS